MDDTQLENLNDESNWGGKRDGAGRPKGSKSESTLEKERVLNEVRQRIMKKSQDILNAQLSLGQGQQFLYRIDTTVDSNGKKNKSKPTLVTDPEEISSYLDGEFSEGESMNTDTEYYFITTKEPSNMAIDSMFDRTFDKPKQGLELGGEVTTKVVSIDE